MRPARPPARRQARLGQGLSPTRRAYLPAAAVFALYALWRILLAANVGWHDESAAFDFEHNFWIAAKHVLHGETPFAPHRRDVLATGTAFLYPAPTALLLAPFGLLSLHAAAALYTLVLLAALPASLYLAGVPDRRCYLAILLWLPVQSAISTANLTLLLALGAALVWRYRDRPAAGGIAVAATIALKPFVWPLLLWLLATRRFAAAAWAVGAGLAITLGSWAVLGFEGIGDFLPNTRLLTKLEARHSYTPYVVALKLGLWIDLARVLAVLVALAVVGWLLARAWQRDDRRSFALAVVACLACSPVVWLHYYALGIVALAVVKPRIGIVWVLPVLAAGPARLAGPSWLALTVVAVMAVTLLAPLRSGRERYAALSASPRS